MVQAQILSFSSPVIRSIIASAIANFLILATCSQMGERALDWTAKFRPPAAPGTVLSGGGTQLPIGGSG